MLANCRVDQKYVANVALAVVARTGACTMHDQGEHDAELKHIPIFTSELANINTAVTTIWLVGKH